MTDYSDEEITSIKTLFPGMSSYKYKELKETYKLVKIVSEKNTDFWKFSQVYFFGTKTSIVRVNPAGD